MAVTKVWGRAFAVTNQVLIKQTIIFCPEEMIIMWFYNYWKTVLISDRIKQRTYKKIWNSPGLFQSVSVDVSQPIKGWRGLADQSWDADNWLSVKQPNWLLCHLTDSLFIILLYFFFFLIYFFLIYFLLILIISLFLFNGNMTSTWGMTDNEAVFLRFLLRFLDLVMLFLSVMIEDHFLALRARVDM